MNKYIFLLLLVVLFVLSPVISVSAASQEIKNEATASAEVKTFDLFWPVAAGKVPGESLYFLKGLKEKVRELFIFSKYQKVDYNIVLGEKRMAEAEKLLLENKDINNFEKAINMAQEKRLKSISLISEVKSAGENVTSLVDRLQSSLTKQQSLETFWKTKMIEGSESILSSDLDKLTSDLAKLSSN